MFVKSIMASKPRTTGAQEDVASAAKRMRENNVGCLIVVNSNAVQGIITDRDLTIGCLAEGHDSTRCMVSSHMSSPAVTVPPAMDVMDAARLMVEKNVKRLPVVENGKLVGLISFSDIALAMDQPVHNLLIGMGAARKAAA